MRLTERACRDLARTADAAGRPFRWDDGVPGFGARLNAPGKLSFVVKYRVKGDPRQRLVTLGDFPSVSAEAARGEAAAIREAARLGRDLLAERAAWAAREAERRRAEAARGVPVADLLDGWRASLEASVEAKRARGERHQYERDLLRLEANTIRAELADRTAGGLDPERFQAMVLLQPTVNHARNLRNALARFTKWANAEMTRRGTGVGWPTAFRVEGRPRSRRHRFALEEAARLWIGAGALGRRGAMVRCMLLTGCRRGEAASMEWPHLRLDDPVLGPHWEQPGRLTKNKEPHRVPLSAPAVALLRWLPPRETKESGPAALVFAGRGNRPVGGWTLIRRALLASAGVDTGTLHDFRRTIVSALGDRGFDPEVADKLLNHAAANTMSGVMGVYQRSELWAKRREAIEVWTGLLMEAVGREAGAPVPAGTWGFEAPFADARIKRPLKGADAGQAARKGPPANRNRTRSQSDRSASK